MTGAPVPTGADAVVMVEYSSQLDAKSGRGSRSGGAWMAGENIVPRGAEARAGACLIESRARMNAAARGAGRVCVQSTVAGIQEAASRRVEHRRRAVDVETTPGPTQIRNSKQLFSGCADSFGGAVNQCC